MLGWIGNVFIVGGLWGVGDKKRNAFLLSILGEGFWILNSYQTQNWALFSICWVFLIMAARGWVKWGS